jgi:hypothetical protein
VKVTAPVPDPPDVVKVIFVPTLVVSVSFDNLNTACSARNVKVAVALVASIQPVDAAFVAVTTHVAGGVAFNEVPLTEHPVPVTVYATTPSPDPPNVASSTPTPSSTASVIVVFDTDSVAWGEVHVKTTVSLVAPQ